MTGETKLENLLKSMKPILKDGEFVFCTLPHQHIKELELKPIGCFQEDEGMTVILQRQQADNLNLEYSYVARMITLSVHSSLNAVGFLAAITTKLAQCGISVNPISAFYHDHLFVPSTKANEVMALLAEFS